MSIIFGPVISRRFGKSLGVDLSPNIKQCNFDCLYCELKPQKRVQNFSDILPVEEILSQIKEALKEYRDIDVLTFTANGEPTLYPHLGELIDEVNKIKGNIKTLILSNSSTINQKSTQKALKKFDTVKLSFDCFSKECFKRLDRAVGVDIEEIKDGIREFAKEFKGELVVEVLVVKGINDKPKEISQIASFLAQIKPLRVDFGSIDRPPAYDVEGVGYEELLRLSLLFPKEINLSITTKKQTSTKKFHFSKSQILETLKRRPLTKSDIEALFDEESKETLKELLRETLIEEVQRENELFFTLK